MIAELQEAARRALDGAGVAANEAKTWPLLVELGWLLVAVPEDLGGLEQGLPGACAIYAELGRSLAAAPYLPAMLAIDALSHGALKDRDSWIERLTAGEYVAAPLGALALNAAKGRLSGAATAVQAADKAKHVLVWTEDVVAFAALEENGAEITPRTTWDKTRRLFDVHFKECELDDALVLAKGAEARALSARLAAHRDFALASECVGAADALLAMTVEYLKTRKQYGRPLAMFQALKHRCADLKTQTSAAEALLLDSLSRLENADPAPMASMTKQLAAATYFWVAEEALQLHGGIAMTSEHVCHLYVKRAMLNQHLGEGADRYELDIAKSVLDV